MNDQYSVTVESTGNGSLLIYVLDERGKRKARVSSLVSGVACNVYIPADASDPVNAQSLSLHDALRRAQEAPSVPAKKASSKSAA